MDERYKKMEDFETMHRHTFWQAFVAAVLHKAATWLGRAAVAWATIVLLGGFVSQLAISDFAIITLLVLRIIVLLALALFTCKLVTKKSALSTGSLHPLQLTYRDPLLSKVNGVKIFSIIFQSGLLIWAVWISVSNMHRPSVWHYLHRYAFSIKPHADNEAALPSLQASLQSCVANHSLTDPSALLACSEFCFPAQNSTTADLQVFLSTFHSLVILTCIAAAFCNVYVFICVVKTPKSLSLARYHDEVLSRGLSIELLEADAFDWRDFLLRSVGDDLVVRNIAPLEVKRQNEDFIEYLFYYPKGVEMVMGMLASENSLLQQTAANMPGFWSFNPKGMEKDGMELLSRLGDKLGFPGKVAEGAANSFKSLAIAWSGYQDSPLLKVYVSRSGGRGPNAVSRSGGGVEGGSEPTNAVSRSGGRGDGASSSNISTESIYVPSSSEIAGRGGSGTSESSSEGGEGHGRSQSRGGGNGDMDSVSGGPGEGAGESMSTLPESSKIISGSSQGAGQGAADHSSRGRSGGSGGEEGGEQNWNVVQKLVDLVTNKRLSTLQVYVRALDSFFMSKSVKNSLIPEEREQIKSKLLMIIQGRSNRASASASAHGADRKTVEIDLSTKARTRLLAFSALDRLGCDGTWVGGALLDELDGELNQVQNNFVIWFEEVTRYKELSKPRGEWLNSGKWDIRGKDFMKSQ